MGFEPRRDKPTPDRERSLNVQGTQSLDRAIALIREVATFGRQGARLTELIQRCEMEYPTAHRIIKSLVANEVLRKDEATRRYHLGQLLYELGLTTEPRLDIRRYCDPMTTRLAELTGDTVFLNIRSGFDVVCVDRKEGSYPIKTFVFDIGSRRPLGIGAAGIALLIHEAPDALQEIIRRNAVRFSQYTNISARQAITLVAQARDCGYAAIGDVVFPRVRAVSVPFLVNSTAPFAAVSVAAVSTRLPTSRIPALVALIKAELDSLKST